MGVFDSNATLHDFFVNLFDRSIRPGGVLDPSDDLHRLDPEVDIELDPADLPFDRLDDAIDLIDYRQERRSKKQKRGRARGTRKISQVDTLWLHQTAALLADPPRFLSVPAQRGVDTNARGILLHPLRAYLYHGHTANSRSIGYEIACRAAGIVHDPLTFWRSKRERDGYTDARGRWHGPKKYADLVWEASDEQIETARHMIRYDVEETKRQGGEIRFIGAHRQSSNKMSDCGQRLWMELGEWAMLEFGLQESKVFRGGNPLPRAWTGRGDEPYNWRVRGY